MKPAAKPGLLLVATRELRWMQRDGVALILAVLVPVLAFAILTLTFSNAVIRNLRVAIVDADRSATSLIYVQSIASAPGVTVAERSSDMRSAMQAVRAGDAIAAVYIPENFERDLLARKRPQVVSLYNRQYFTPGNNAASSISSAISAATAALPHEAESGYKPGVLVAEQYVLSNPALELRPVPVAGGSAHCAARRDGDRRRLCGRLGVLPAQQARLDARGRRPAAGRARRQIPAFVRHLHHHDAGGRRHHPRPLRGLLSEATRC